MFSVHFRTAPSRRVRAPLRAQRALRAKADCLVIAAALVLGASAPLMAGAQLTDPVAKTEGTGGVHVDSLIAMALANGPTIRAARARLDAVRSRVGPAGLRADPMLMAGVQNFPVSDPGFEDEMTMKMVGIAQTIPYRGKLGLTRRIAEHEASAAEASVIGATSLVARDVRSAYYELAFLDRALAIVARNRDVLAGLGAVTESRYANGSAGQQDVLKARVEAARLAETAVDLTERRRATLALLNALLDRPSDSPIEHPVIPRRIATAAVADSGAGIRFVSASLGARVTDSPLPSVQELQALARGASPMLLEAEAMVAAQRARGDLARLGSMPDIDVSLEYGQRSGYPDMVSATVAIPLPLQKRRKQDAQVIEARAELAAAEADRHARRNEILADVARLHSELERDRAGLALYVKSIIPQGRAALTAATSSYGVGRVEFLTLLDNQATLFSYETEYFRLLSDFATRLAELEQVVGKAVLP